MVGFNVPSPAGMGKVLADVVAKTVAGRREFQQFRGDVMVRNFKEIDALAAEANRKMREFPDVPGRVDVTV